jgi:hypothetical protein
MSIHKKMNENVWYKSRNLFMKIGMSLCMTWLMRWESYLDHAKAFWLKKCYTSDGLQQNSCIVCQLMGKAESCQYVPGLLRKLQNGLQFLFKVITGDETEVGNEGEEI